MKITHALGKSTDLASFKGRNGDTYVVSAGKDGHVYCSCPAWRFQRCHPADRTCKHINEYLDAVRDKSCV